MDESHIVPRELTKRKVLGLVKESTLHQKSASITIVASLDENEPVLFDYRIQSNTQWNFVSFVWYCIKVGRFQEGDFLVVDNAAVHGGSESYPLLQLILDVAKLTLVFLPAYSPELNPCELVFNITKTHLRNHTSDQQLLLRLGHAISTVTYQKMLGFYQHCILPKTVLADY